MKLNPIPCAWCGEKFTATRNQLSALKKDGVMVYCSTPCAVRAEMMDRELYTRGVEVKGTENVTWGPG